MVVVGFEIIKGDWGYAVTVYCVHVLNYQFVIITEKAVAFMSYFNSVISIFDFPCVLFCHYRKSTYFEITFYLLKKIL